MIHTQGIILSDFGAGEVSCYAGYGLFLGCQTLQGGDSIREPPTVKSESHDREKVSGLVCVGCLRSGTDNVYLGSPGS